MRCCGTCTTNQITNNYTRYAESCPGRECADEPCRWEIGSVVQPPAIFITITMFGPGLGMCVRTAPDLARQTAQHSFQPPLCELRSLHSSTASPICPSELCPTEFYTLPKEQPTKVLIKRPTSLATFCFWLLFFSIKPLQMNIDSGVHC